MHPGIYARPLADLSSKMVALTTSTLVTAASWCTSTTYGVGLGKADVLAVVVKGIQGTLSVFQQGEYYSILAILALFGVVEIIQLILSAFHAGWLGVLICLDTFIIGVLIFSFDDVIIRSLGVIALGLFYVIAGWYKPDSW